MKSRVALFFSVAFALATFLASPGSVCAEEVHDGKVVSVTKGADGADDKLVMQDKDGKKEHTHSVGTTAKITLDKKEAKLTDLKKGDIVSVTLDDKGKVTAVVASREKA